MFFSIHTPKGASTAHGIRGAHLAAAIAAASSQTRPDGADLKLGVLFETSQHLAQGICGHLCCQNTRMLLNERCTLSLKAVEAQLSGLPIAWHHTVLAETSLGAICHKE